jgi:methyl-accepting chemotaxis protein
MKFKSITTQITLLFGILMFVICFGLGACSYLNSRNALKTNIDENILEIARADAKIISEKVNTQLNTLEALANNPSIKSSNYSAY